MPAATRCAGPASSARTCRSSRTSTSRTRHRIQVRIEGFNIWNQARFGQPNGIIGTAPFGQITTAEDGRVIQLGLKYSF